MSFYYKETSSSAVSLFEILNDETEKFSDTVIWTCQTNQMKSKDKSHQAACTLPTRKMAWLGIFSMLCNLKELS